MSKRLFLIPAILFIFLFFFGCEQQIDVKAEKEAIKEVLRAQLDAMKNFSVDPWQILIGLRALSEFCY